MAEHIGEYTPSSGGRIDVPHGLGSYTLVVHVHDEDGRAVHPTDISHRDKDTVRIWLPEGWPETVKVTVRS